MKVLLFTLFISQMTFAAEANLKQTRWQKLMHLVSQEMKILESAKRKGVEIKYRMLELHSERLKLIHEKNNAEFMEKSKALGSGKEKEKFFSETRAYYQLTRQFGDKILKEEAKNHRKAEIMFALALNSRDYGQDNITEKYLLNVISLVQDPTNSLRHHAETALADFYYNEKRFPEAITYYQRVITKTQDDWMTKHLFNLSWCYLKHHEFDKAIETIKKSYFESKNPAYVNIKDQVLDNIGSFYVYAGRPLEGLDFYLKNEPDPISYLILMAQKTADKGHEKETKEILDAAQKVIDNKDFYQYQEELLHAYLDYYRHYNRFSEHEKISRNMVAYYKKAGQEIQKNKKSPFKMELKDDAIEKMRSLAGFLQVKLAKDIKKDETQFSHEELEIVLNFFSHLLILDPARRVEYLYFKAETYFSVNEYKLAAASYVDAVKEAKIAKNEEHARKSLDSLLALTGQEVLDKNENTKYLVFSYSEYLEWWPRDTKSEQIYPKLFEIYRESFDDVKATQVIRSFNKAYPEHLADQQVFMTKILDQFIDKKNTDKLTFWISEFKTGLLSYSKQTIEKMEIVLGNILFLQYQDMAKRGERLAAAKGFESLYNHKLYPNKVKYQAALFSAMAYLELGETEKSFEWQQLAHLKMTEEEKLERREEQVKMSERTYRLQDFKTSFKSAEFLLQKFCSLKDDTQNRLYEIAVMTSLVEEKPAETEKIVKNYSQCLSKPETRDQAVAQIYDFHQKKGDFFALRSFIKVHPVEPYLTQYRFSIQKWYWESNDNNLKDHILTEFKQMKHPEALEWLKEINLYHRALKDKEELFSVVVWAKPQFDGELFNKSLEGYLLKLKNYKEAYHSLTQSKQIDLAIMSTRTFAEVYLHIGTTIQSLRPEGMDQKTMIEFQGAMKQLSAQFTTASLQYNQNLAKSLKAKAPLVTGARSIASIDEIENPIVSSITGLTMDKIKE